MSNGYLTDKEFQEFKKNDFHSLKCEVSKLSATVSFIRGQIWVILPILLALLGMLGYLITR